jgi:hypothetical protein
MYIIELYTDLITFSTPEIDGERRIPAAGVVAHHTIS